MKTSPITLPALALLGYEYWSSGRPITLLAIAVILLVCVVRQIEEG